MACFSFFDIFYFVFTFSSMTKPRSGGVLELPWHLDVSKRPVCSLAHSLCGTAEIRRRSIRSATRKSRKFPGNSLACGKLGVARSVGLLPFCRCGLGIALMVKCRKEVLWYEREARAFPERHHNEINLFCRWAQTARTLYFVVSTHSGNLGITICNTPAIS